MVGNDSAACVVEDVLHKVKPVFEVFLLIIRNQRFKGVDHDLLALLSDFPLNVLVLTYGRQLVLKILGVSILDLCNRGAPLSCLLLLFFDN